MKISKLYIVLLFFILIISFILFLYCNPSIKDEDFDLEYKVLNNKKTYFEDRNNKIKIDDYNFNEILYCNYINGDKIIIHSLDIINGKERVIFLLEQMKKKEIIAVSIDYYYNNKFLNYQVNFLNDSIYVWDREKVLFFKGVRCIR